MLPGQLFGLLKYQGGATQLRSGLVTKVITVYPAFPTKIQGLSIDQAGGFSARLPESAIQYLADDTAQTPNQIACNLTLIPLDELTLCRTGETELIPTVVNWGDSHGLALIPLLDQFADREEARVFHGARSQCLPLIGAEVYNGPDCVGFNAQVFKQIEELHPDHVMLTGRWAFYIEGLENSGPDLGERPSWLMDEQTKSRTPEQARAVFARLLADTVDQLRGLGAEVWIVRQVPEQLFVVPRRLAIGAQNGDDLNSLGRPASDYWSRQRLINEVIDSVIEDGVRAIDPAAVLCDPSRCRVYADQHSLYKDGDHLSAYGAVWIEAAFVQLVDALKLPPPAK